MVFKREMKISLIVYTKNEIDGMMQIMPQIRKEWYDQLLIVDGASKDGTLEYARAQGYDVCLQKEPCWEGAYREAHRHAAGDILIDFSPDGNSDPRAIPLLAQKILEGYDMVIASRYAKGARSEDDSSLTGFGNFLFTTMINILFRAHYTDTLVIYRAYRRSLLKEVGLDQDKDHSFTAQLAIRCAKMKKKVTDIPVVEPARIGGRTKLRPWWDGLLNLILILKEFILYRDQKCNNVTRSFCHFRREKLGE